MTELTSLPSGAASATALTVGTEHEGALRRGEGVRDWYRVTLAAGTGYEVTMTQVMRNGKLLRWPTIYGVYDPAGDALPRTRSIGGSSNPSFTPLDSAAARVRFNAPSAGEYRISVGDASGVSVAMGGAFLDVYPYAIEVTTALPPGRPQSLMATAGPGKVVLTWEAAASLGGARPARYEYRHAAGTSVPSGTAWVSAGKALRATVRGLVDGTAYAFQVRAVNVVAGAAATARATPMAGICLAPDLAGRTQIWTAEMTVGDWQIAPGFRYFGYVRPPNSIGTLSDSTFDPGSGTRTIELLTWEAEGANQGALAFALLKTDTELTNQEQQDLRLHVCDDEWNVADAQSLTPSNRNAYTWRNSGLDWSSVTTRTLYLSVPGETSGTRTVTETTDCPDTNPTCTFNVGDTVEGSLDSSSDQDGWLVDLEEGKTYRFDVGGKDLGGGTLADGVMVLYAPGGNEVDSDIDQITHAVVTGQGGTYTVTVYSDASQTGGYRLTVTDVTSMGQEEDSTPEAQVTETADCPAATPTCTFTVGETVDGALDPASDIDSWLVDLEEGKTYQFDVEGRDGGDGALPDPYVYLYPPTGGNEVASDTGTSAEFTYAVQTGDGGTYTLDVESNSGVTGGYRIAVTDITPMMQEEDSTPLTAEFTTTPYEHDGATPFNVDVRFNDAITTSAEQMRAGVEITGGSATGAARRDVANQEIWRITVTPSGNADVVVRVPVTNDCSGTGAICASGGRGVSEALSTTVFRAGLLAAAASDVPKRARRVERVQLRGPLLRSAENLLPHGTRQPVHRRRRQHHRCTTRDQGQQSGVRGDRRARRGRRRNPLGETDVGLRRERGRVHPGRAPDAERAERDGARTRRTVGGRHERARSAGGDARLRSDPESGQARGDDRRLRDERRDGERTRRLHAHRGDTHIRRRRRREDGLRAGHRRRP